MFCRSQFKSEINTKMLEIFIKSELIISSNSKLNLLIIGIKTNSWITYPLYLGKKIRLGNTLEN